jgi:hypothetical protein
MISRELIKSLSSLEQALLLYVLNRLHSSVVEVDLDTVCAYKIDALKNKLKESAGQVRPEGLDSYKKLCGRFGVEL